MIEWQDIATAPMDGEEVLGWNLLDRRVVWWHRDDYGNSGFICGFDGEEPNWQYPTKWQSLPPPPGEDK